MFRVNVERVASETLDGEVVILDQVEGTYFSLGGAGADVWQMLLGGASTPAIVAAMCARFEGDAGAIGDAVTQLVERLAAEGLLDVVEGDAAPASSSEPEAARRPWVAPRLDRFTDLQSLLLLDPIHDVDESGWPHPPSSAS